MLVITKISTRIENVINVESVAKHSGINAIFTDTPKCTKGMNLHVNIVGKKYPSKAAISSHLSFASKDPVKCSICKNYSIITKLLRNT